MAFSRGMAKSKAPPAPAVEEDSGDEVEDVDEGPPQGGGNTAEQDAEDARAKAFELEQQRRKQAMEEESARRRKALDDARAKKEEEARRKAEYEQEKARQQTIARSKAETAKRYGGGFGGGDSGGSFAWKKSAAPAGGGGASKGSRPSGMPSHDECELAISAMLSRSNSGMKEGIAALGIDVVSMDFIAGERLWINGYNLREEINQAIHGWMTDEKDSFYEVLAVIKEKTSRPMLTEDELKLMESGQDKFERIVDKSGRVMYQFRGDGAGQAAGNAAEDRPAKPKPLPEVVEDDSDDEVIDVVPGNSLGSLPKPKAAPRTAAKAAEVAPPRAAPAPAAAAPGPAETSHYELLDVSPDATLQEIRQKFRQLVITEHPEKGGDAKKFARLNKAYSVLSDQKKRAEYDASLAGTGSSKRVVD